MKTIKEKAKEASPFLADQEWYIKGATEQQKTDKALFVELIHNLMEIGDIEVHNIDKVVELINKKMEG